MFLSETTLSQKFKTTLEAKNDQQILSALLSPIPIKLSAEAVAAFFASLAFNLHCARAPGIQGAEVYMRLTSFVWTNPAVLLLDPSRIHFWKLLCFIPFWFASEHQSKIQFDSAISSDSDHRISYPAKGGPLCS